MNMSAMRFYFRGREKYTKSIIRFDKNSGAVYTLRDFEFSPVYRTINSVYRRLLYHAHGDVRAEFSDEAREKCTISHNTSRRDD